MQKTVIYLLLLLIIGAGVYFLVLGDKGNPFGKKEAGFKVEDTGSIARIFLARPNGETITLQRTDSGWTVNGQYGASSGVLRNLLTTLHKQEAQYPVPNISHNSVIKSMAAGNVKVELYDRKDNNINTFYVGGEASNFAGSYMLMDHAAKPYVVQVPGFEGYPGAAYVTDLTEWRDRTVFHFQPEEIGSVAVKYMNEPLNSFTIQQNGKLSLIADPGISAGNALNEARVAAYLKFFDRISCEGFLTGLYGIDSAIMAKRKYCAIDVKRKHGRGQHADIYYMPLNKRSKNRLSEVPADYDPDRLYAVINGFRDTVIIQQAQFEKLFRKAYEFYQEDKVQNVPAASKL